MPRVLVAGPPCGGKSSYVRSHAEPGERVLDFDDIVEELTGARYGERSEETVAAARRIWMERLPRSDWVVWLAPRRSQRARFRREFGAQLVVVTAPMSVCLERAEAERPASWLPVVRRWFRDFEPWPGRELVVLTGGAKGVVVDRWSPNA